MKTTSPMRRPGEESPGVAAPPPEPLAARVRKQIDKHRRPILIALAAAIGVLVILECWHQIRIQRAIAWASHGEHERIVSSLGSGGFGILRNGTEKDLVDTARYRLAVEQVDDLLDVRNWFAGRKCIETMLALGPSRPSYAADLDAVVGVWDGALRRLIADGEYATCSAALDTIADLAPCDDSSARQLGRLTLAIPAELAHGFAVAEAWLPALEEIDGIAAHPLSPPERVEDLRAAVRERMKRSLDVAVADRNYEKAKAILRLFESHFPDHDDAGAGLYGEMQYAEALSQGRDQEARSNLQAAVEAYDRALALKPGDRAAFDCLRRTREALGRRDLGSAAVRDSPESETVTRDVARAASICAGAYRYPIYGGRGHDQRVNAIERASVRSARGVQARWSFAIDDTRSEWVIEFDTQAPSSGSDYRSNARGAIELAVVLLDESRKPIDGRVCVIPLLLEGEQRRVEIRLPRTAVEQYVSADARN